MIVILLSVALLVIRLQLDGTKDDRIMALYAILASSVSAFLIWTLTAHVYKSLGAEILGFIMGGAFLVNFGGYRIKGE